MPKPAAPTIEAAVAGLDPDLVKDHQSVGRSVGRCRRLLDLADGVLLGLVDEAVLRRPVATLKPAAAALGPWSELPHLP